MATQQQVFEGYRQTEVGVIPEDWIVEPLENFTAFISYGFTNPMPTTIDGPFMVTARDINSGRVLYESARQTSEEAYRSLLSPKSRPKLNDILLTKDGTLGRLALVDKEGICINQSVALLRPNDRVEPLYFKKLLESPSYQKKMIEDAGGSTIKHIYITIVNRMLVSLPASKEEQTAIANTLSDVDALITSLEKLIAKKRAIKTAAMQQLLTGKKRLPPFDQTPDGKKRGYKQTELGEIPEDWEIVSLGDIALIDPENLGASTDSDYEFDYISLEQIDRGALIGTTKIKYGSAPSRARRVIRKGDILVSTVRPNLMSHYMQKEECKDLICSTGFSVLRPKINTSDSNLLFFHLFAGVVNRQIEMLISGSNYPAINSGDVKGLKISLPCFEEQVEIASVLSEIDNEIVALDKSLNKTKKLKQGMMQELLTGRTRLV